MIVLFNTDKGKISRRFLSCSTNFLKIRFLTFNTLLRHKEWINFFYFC